MANQNNHKKNFINILVIGLIAVCVALLFVEIVSNTVNELQVNQSNEGYAVFMEFDTDGNAIKIEPTPTPTRDPSLPTPTYDITEGE